MTWDHRMVRVRDGEDTLISLCEVFYNEAGQPTGFCEPFMHGDTVEEVEELVRRLGVAVSLPVLHEDIDFNNPTDV